MIDILGIHVVATLVRMPVKIMHAAEDSKSPMLEYAHQYYCDVMLHASGAATMGILPTTNVAKHRGGKEADTFKSSLKVWSD